MNFLSAKAFLLTLLPLHAEQLTVVAGGGAKVADAPATECALHEPFGVEFAADGSMIIVEMERGQRVLRVDPRGVLTVLAGTGVKGFGGDGGPARDATFNGLHNLAIAPDGAIYLADTWNYRIRRIDPKTQIITTFAGTGKKGFSGDGGPAAEADFGSVIQIALDPKAAHLYVADIDNRRIRRITLATGLVETVAGNGQRAAPTDGADAKAAPLLDPRAVAIAPDGGFYILERGGHALRHVDPAGKIRAVAGTGKAGATGDGGDARLATLNGPKHLCVASDGTVLIADAENHLIRRYEPATGLIHRVAGDGTPTVLRRPHGVTIQDGALYITDTYHDRILRFVP